MTEVVLAREDHLHFLRGIELDAATICPLEDLPEPLRAESMPLDILRTALKQGLLLVAIENGDTPIGFAACAVIENYLHLLEIDVASRMQHKGIGSLLLNKVIDIAIERGLVGVSLTTFSHLPWNAPWYKKKGFTRIISAELPAFLAEILKEEAARGLNPDNRVAMRKKLTSNS